MKRINLTEREAELIQAFRAERNIYNGALADALAVLAQHFPEMKEPMGSSNQAIVSASRDILALRKED